MERGTEQEKQALEEAWATIEEQERQKRRANTQLFGSLLVSAGLIITAIALALPPQLCIHQAKLTDPGCKIQNISPEFILTTIIASSSMIIGGGYILWRLRTSAATG